MFNKIQKFSLPFRHLSSQPRPLETPACLVVTTWPSCLIHNSGFKPLSSIEAKNKLEQERNIGGIPGTIDPLGHANLECIVNLKHEDVNVEDIGKEIPKVKSSQKVHALRASISWYPDGDHTERGNLEDEKQLISHLPTLNPGSPEEKIQQAIIDFLMYQQIAANVDVSHDIEKYGQADPNRVIVLKNINIIDIIRELALIMDYDIDQSGKIVFNLKRGHAQYDFLDLVRTFNYVMCSSNTLDRHIVQEHVCTTAVFKGFRSSYRQREIYTGNEEYYRKSTRTRNTPGFSRVRS